MGSAPLEHIADIVVEENHDIEYDLHKNIRGFPTNLDT
jgi:hypothetical protein